MKLESHDLYPRREDEISESEVQLGLDAGLTWAPISILPKVTYSTKIRRINTYLVAGSVLTAAPWWRFETRKGEKSILGAMETLLTVQVDYDRPCLGKAKLAGYLSGWGSKINPEVSVNFDLSKI